MSRVITYDFVPSPKQELAMSTYADEILYGGSAGGGKSRWARAEHVRLALTVPGSRSLLLRRTYPMLKKDVIPKFIAEIPRTLARFNKTDSEWTFTNGSVIELGHMLNDEAVVNYQSAEYQMITFEEATQFTEFQFNYMPSRLRSAGRVEEIMRALGLRPRICATANPGGIGHAWVKAHWIDPAPPMTLFAVAHPPPLPGEPPITDPPKTRIFIPARVDDNPHVDPNYVRQLNELDPDTRRALRDGDWDSYSGQRFSGWRNDVHVITPEQAAQLMPAVGGIRAVGVDYGMDAPFAAHWMWLGPDGLVVVYRELYEAGLTPNEQAKAIRDAEAPGERDPGRPIPVALDPSTWARNAHTKPALNPKLAADVPPPGSIAHSYWRAFGGQLVKANNDRLAGVALVADKLRVRRDGMPRLLVVDTCRNLIRTLPALIRDPRRPEDVDCFVAGTLIDTPTGPRHVETIRVGDLVSTPMGPQRVIKAHPEGDTTVARVEFTDGTVLVGTADHEIACQRGLVPLRELRTTDRAVTREDTWTPATPSSTAATPTVGSPVGSTTSPPPGPRNATAASHSTVTSTRTTTAPSRPASTSTTSTTTPRTTTHRTWAWCRRAITHATTWLTEPTRWPPPAASGKRPTTLSGSSVRRSGRPLPTPQRLRWRALIVEALSSAVSAETGTAPEHAATSRVADGTSASARSAEPGSAGRSTARTSHRPAPTRVDGSYGVATVYALTVDGCGLYYANGILVTNTDGEDHGYDALRYGLMEISGRRPNRDHTSQGKRSGHVVRKAPARAS